MRIEVDQPVDDLLAPVGQRVACAVRDLSSMPVVAAEPVRRFAWHARQRHRPGLQYLVSTGRHHGFESMAEQRLLLGWTSPAS